MSITSILTLLASEISWLDLFSDYESIECHSFMNFQVYMWVAMYYLFHSKIAEVKKVIYSDKNSILYYGFVSLLIGSFHYNIPCYSLLVLVGITHYWRRHFSECKIFWIESISRFRTLYRSLWSRVTNTYSYVMYNDRSTTRQEVASTKL